MTEPREPTFSLLVFTWNEIDGCKAILPQIERSLFKQILIVDAHSTDGTPEWCQAQGFEVFMQSTNGLRQAYLEVLPHITGDYFIGFSPDGNSLADKLPELVAKVKEGNYDMVIVSRYLGEAKSADDNAITGFGNWMFTTLVNLLHRGHYTDVMVMYRAVRTSLLHNLRLDDPEEWLTKWIAKIFFATTMGNEPLMSARAARAGYKVGEIPGDEPPRIGGKAKLKVVQYGLATMAQFLLEVFIPPSRYRRKT